MPLTARWLRQPTYTILRRYYWEAKAAGFSFFAADEMAAWVHFGVGQALWDELSAVFSAKSLLAQVRKHGCKKMKRCLAVQFIS